jgi:putative Mn2+ efflux pump MntP
MFLAAFIIGSITFIIAMLGLLFGKKLGERIGKKMEIIGGIILIALGLKILIEHLLS